MDQKTISKKKIWTLFFLWLGSSYLFFYFGMLLAAAVASIGLLLLLGLLLLIISLCFWQFSNLREALSRLKVRLYKDNAFRLLGIMTSFILFSIVLMHLHVDSVQRIYLIVVDVLMLLFLFVFPCLKYRGAHVDVTGIFFSYFFQIKGGAFCREATVAIFYSVLIRYFKCSKPASCSLFYQVLGETGPIEDVEQDELGRADFAKKFAELLMHDEKSLTFGINGIWGIGKTSFFNLVKDSLPDSIVVECLESWHYRQPDSILQVFFDKISKRLGEYCSSKLRIKRFLYELLSNSATLNLGWLGFSLPLKWLLEGNSDPKKVLIKIIEKEFAKHQLVFIIDDLDRLDREELHAVLRATRLLHDLPRIQFVLAYDKKLISKQLFPEDKSGMLARDYMAKIVQVEINLSIPPQEIRVGILNEIFKNSMLNEIKDEFLAFAKESSKLVEAIFTFLPTKREINIVLAMAVWIHMQHKGAYYFIDLFLLTLLQHRSPQVYTLLQENACSITDARRCFLNMSCKNTKLTQSEACEFLRKIFKQITNDGKDMPVAKVICFLLGFQELYISSDTGGKTNLHDIFRMTACGTDTNCFFNKLGIFSDTDDKTQLHDIFTPISPDADDDCFFARRFLEPDFYDSYFQYSYSDLSRSLDGFIQSLESLSIVSNQKQINSIFEEYPEILYEHRYFKIFVRKVMNSDRGQIDGAAAFNVLGQLMEGVMCALPKCTVEKEIEVRRMYVLYLRCAIEENRYDYYPDYGRKILEIFINCADNSNFSLEFCFDLADLFVFGRHYSRIRENIGEFSGVSISSDDDTNIKLALDDLLQKILREYLAEKAILTKEMAPEILIIILLKFELSSENEQKILAELRNEPQKLKVILDALVTNVYHFRSLDQDPPLPSKEFVKQVLLIIDSCVEDAKLAQILSNYDAQLKPLRTFADSNKTAM